MLPTAQNTSSNTQFLFDDIPKIDFLSVRLPVEQRESINSGVRPKLQRMYQNVKEGLQALTSYKKASIGTLSTEDIERFNYEMSNNIDHGIQQLKESLVKQLAVTANDTLESAQLKLVTSKGFMSWFIALGAWLSSKLQKIWQKIKDSINWVIEATKELFQHLFSLFE